MMAEMAPRIFLGLSLGQILSAAFETWLLGQPPLESWGSEWMEDYKWTNSNPNPTPMYGGKQIGKWDIFLLFIHGSGSQLLPFEIPSTKKHKGILHSFRSILPVPPCFTKMQGCKTPHCSLPESFGNRTSRRTLKAVCRDYTRQAFVMLQDLIFLLFLLPFTDGYQISLMSAHDQHIWKKAIEWLYPWQRHSSNVKVYKRNNVTVRF